MKFLRIFSLFWIVSLSSQNLWAMKKNPFCLHRVVNLLQSRFVPLNFKDPAPTDAAALELKNKWMDLVSKNDIVDTVVLEGLIKQTTDFFWTRAQVRLVWQQDLEVFLVEPTPNTPLAIWLDEMRTVKGFALNIYLFPPVRYVVENNLTEKTFFRDEHKIIFSLVSALDAIVPDRVGEGAFALGDFRGLTYLTRFTLGSILVPFVARTEKQWNDSIEDLVVQKAILGRFFTEIEKYSKLESLTAEEMQEVKLLVASYISSLDSLGDSSQRLHGEFGILLASVKEPHELRLTVTINGNLVTLQNQLLQAVVVENRSTSTFLKATVKNSFIFEFGKDGFVKKASRMIEIEDTELGHRTFVFPLPLDTGDVSNVFEQSEFSKSEFTYDLLGRIAKTTTTSRDLISKYLVESSTQAENAMDSANKLLGHLEDLVPQINNPQGDVLRALKHFVEATKPTIRNYPF
jgi:hypothetical protein